MFPHPAVAAAYYNAGLRFGSKLSLAEVDRRFRDRFRRHHVAEATSDDVERMRWESLVADVFDDVQRPGDLFQHLWEHFARPDSWRLFDDVESTWNELDRRGYVLGIASNFDSRLMEICRGLSPLERTRHVFCSSSIGFPKPRPEFFERIQQQLEIMPQEILLVGDDEENDVSAPRAAGWQTVHVSRDRPSPAKPAIGTLAKLLELLPASPASSS